MPRPSATPTSPQPESIKLDAEEARGSETEDRDALGIAPLRTHSKMISPVQSPIAKTEPIQLDDGERGGLEFLSRMGRPLAAPWLALSRPQLFPSWPVLAGAASGLAYGYKPLHLVGAVLVGLLILFGRAPLVQTRPSGATRVWQSATFASAFLALAGIWLLRNQVQLGSPLYPIPLGVCRAFSGSPLRRTGPTMR